MVVSKLILKRIAASLVLLFIASFVVFAGIRATVDPAQYLRNTKSPETIKEYEQTHHLDEPIIKQYSRWLTNALHGDLGVGDRDGQEVTQKLKSGLGKSFELIVWGILFSAIFGITSGVISGIKKNKVSDVGLQSLAAIGIAIPAFWFAYTLIKLFTEILPDRLGVGTIFYVNGNADGLFGQTATGLWTPNSIVEYTRHLALPIIVLTIQLAASWSRYQRSSMVESMESDFIRSAKAKGLPKRRVYFKHAFRNAQLPMINVIALDIGALFGGLIITEHIFGINGMGAIFIEALNEGDATTLVSWTMITAIAIIAFNLLADILIPIVDPRVRTQ